MTTDATALAGIGEWSGLSLTGCQRGIVEAMSQPG